MGKPQGVGYNDCNPAPKTDDEGTRMHELVCSHCSRHIRVPQLQPGMGVKCPYCQKIFVFTPEPAAAASGVASDSAGRVFGGVPMRQPEGFGGGGVGLAPPPQYAPPQQFAPPGYAPPPPGYGGPPPGFAPPPPGYGGPPNGFSPNGFAPPPNGFAPNGFSPNGFAPPPPGFAPPGYAPPPPPGPSPEKTELTCTHCGKHIRVPGLTPGMGVKCPYCMNVFVFTPGAAPPPPPAPAPEPQVQEPSASSLDPLAALTGAKSAAKPRFVPPEGFGGITESQPLNLPPEPVMMTAAPPQMAPAISPLGMPGAPTPVVVQIPASSDPVDLLGGARKGGRSGKFKGPGGVGAGRTKSGGQVLVGVAALVLVAGAIALVAVLSNRAAKQDQPKDGSAKIKEKDPYEGSKDGTTPVVDPNAVFTKGKPPAPKEGWQRAGYFSKDDLPDNEEGMKSIINPFISFEDVGVDDREVDPVQGGSTGSLVKGRLVNKGPDDMLQVQLQAIRYTRSPNGGYQGLKTASVTIHVIPRGKQINFQIPSKWKKSEMDAFVVLATNSNFDNTKWVKLSECKDSDLVLEVQGAGGAGTDRLLVKGFVQNNSPSVVSEYRVVVDLYDLRSAFLGTVQANWSYDGVGDPFGPGRKKDFEVVDSRFRQADIGSGNIRAIGRTK